MRAVLAAVALVGCSGSAHPVAPDASAPDAAPPYEFRHTTTDVLVTAMDVHWSAGDFVCGLEACPAETPAPVLSFADRQPPTAFVAYEQEIAAVGPRQLAGDNGQLFYIEGTDLGSTFVKRYSGPTGNVALSIPRRLDIGPAVDASNVYWAETLDGTSYAIRRASRNGDGTDATVVVPTIAVNDATRARLLQAGQQLWWIGTDGSLMRVPVTGGTPMPAIDHADTIAAAGDVVLVSRLVGLGTSQPHREIGTITSGTYQPLLTLDANNPPRFLTAAENAVWWSNGDGNIYSVPLAGGAVTTAAAQMADGPQVFAVLPDRFLVDLTADSLRSVMR